MLSHQPASPLRLRDIRPIADLEAKAVIDPMWAAPAALWMTDRLGEIARAVFGVAASDIRDKLSTALDEATTDEDEQRILADFADAYDQLADPEWDQVRTFADLGWDLLDEFGRPMLVAKHFTLPLLAAIRGEFGATLPGTTPVDPNSWGKALEQEARRFRGGSR